MARARILRIIVRHVYDAILVILGPEGFWFSYAEDVYLGGKPWNVALALDAASGLYAMFELTLGWGPKKTELQLPLDFDSDHLPLPRGDPAGRPIPDVVTGCKACMGVPKHPSSCYAFITTALQPLARRHDTLLDLVAYVSDEDPFASLRLLQVCGVNRFGHVLNIVPPDIITTAFCEERDAAIATALGAIHGIPVDITHSSHTLPVVAGGVGLPSLRTSAAASYLGAFFRVAGPLIARLALMGGNY